MSATDVGFATDNDPDLQYKRTLGSGGYGIVCEVPSQLFNVAHGRSTTSLDKRFESQIFMKLITVIRKEIAPH